MPFELRVPPVGESIAEVQIGVWRKQEGDWIEKDEVLLELETDKAAMEVPAPVSGTVSKLLKKVGEPATVGEVVAYLEESSKKSSERRNPLASAPGAPAPSAPAAPPPAPVNDAPKVMPAAQRELAQRGIAAQDVPPSGPGGRVLKEDVVKFADHKDSKPAPAPTAASAPAAKAEPGAEEIVPMTLIRKRIAARLVEAQQQAALLTTFNEVDMSNVMALRKEHQDAFKDKYGIKLGFMSFFVKATVEALKATPQVNAEIRGTNIVYKNYYDIGVAVGGGKGLVVPIIRRAERLSFADIEKKIAEYGKKAADNKIGVEDLEGGTFTISNGGVYGSLLSTPIVNPPQSGILGLHAIQERPVAREGAVVIRPMMYLALTYDHRIVDGKEAVTFLKRIKDLIENPARILLEV